MYNKDLHDFHSSPNVIKSIEDELGGACCTCGERREIYTEFWWVIR
jgi:hypothetical protein